MRISGGLLGEVVAGFLLVFGFTVVVVGLRPQKNMRREILAVNNEK